MRRVCRPPDPCDARVINVIAHNGRKRGRKPISDNVGRATIAVDQPLLDRFDDLAYAMGINRSEAMRRIMKDWVEAHDAAITNQEPLLAG